MSKEKRLRKYLVSTVTWGGLFADDLEIEANNKQEALKKFCDREGFTNYKVVYDSVKNKHFSNKFVVGIIEGHYKDETKRSMFVSGKRGYYKIVKKSR